MSTILVAEALKRSTTETQDETIFKLFDQTPTMTLREAKQRLQEKVLHLSKETIRKRLAARGLKYKHTMPKPLLNQEYMQNRKLFATENLDRD